MKDNLNVKILVGYHKPATLIKNEIFEPIHLGRALATESSKDGEMSQEDYQWMLDNMIGDDTGENISNQNRYLNEMTALFWAWKNYDKLGNPDYLGFCHYRRVLDFNNYSKDYPIDPSLGIPFVNSLNQHSPLFNVDDIYSTLKRNDCIISANHSVNPVSHFENAGYLNIEDYKKAMSILDEYCPQYSKYAKMYNGGEKSYFCNIFILPKDVFFEYAEFMFEILFKLNDLIDKSDYSIRQERMAAYISEWLTGIFFTYLNAKRNILELPMVYVKHTDVKPVIKKEHSNEVSIVMSSDCNYLPYLAVTIQSIIENSNPHNFYKIYVLNENVSQDDIAKIRCMQKENLLISFVDIKPYLIDFATNLWFEYRHFTKAVYYRFFIPKIFAEFEKIIYCDCDAVFLDDVAKLYDINLENNLIAAVQDVEIKKQLFTKCNLDYYQNVISLKKPDNYFNSGLLIFNIVECNKSNFTDKCLETLKLIKRPYHPDQDILNVICENCVRFLDFSWNVENHVQLENSNLQDLLPKNIYYAYRKSLENPKFLHFTSSLKPWQDPSSLNAHLFWKYARKTSFYEEIIYKNQKSSSNVVFLPQKKFYKNFLQRIFSMKTLEVNNKTFKVVTILGIKIKFKRRKK